MNFISTYFDKVVELGILMFFMWGGGSCGLITILSMKKLLR